MISRRYFLQLAITGATCTAPCASAETPFDWRAVSESWFELLMPPLGDHQSEAYRLINTEIERLMEDPNFREGFLTGLKILKEMPRPSHDESLKALLNSDQPIAHFLRAILDVLLETYYGAALGYRDIQIVNPPQPVGYALRAATD